MVDSAVAIAIGDEHVAVISNGGVGGQVEGASRLMDNPVIPITGVRGAVPGAEGEQQFLVGTVLQNHMRVAVCQPEVAVLVDGNAMRAAELFVPRLDEIPLAAIHLHLVGAAIEQIDVVVLVNGNTGDLVELVAIGEIAPTLGQFVNIISAAIRHDVTPCLGSSVDTWITVMRNNSTLAQPRSGHKVGTLRHRITARR